MSRIVIAIFGSLGDLHPKIAIGLELQRRGHQVVFATWEDYRDRLEKLGFEFHPMRPQGLDLEDPEAIAMIMDLKKGTERLLKDYIFAHLRETYEDLLAICQGADLILVGEIVFAGSMVAEKLGIPWVFCSLAPTSFFSIYDLPVFPPYPELAKLRFLGPLANLPVFKLAQSMTYGWAEPARQLRRELGLLPKPNPIIGDKFSPYLNLALFSPLLAKAQRDWPANCVLTGFTFYDGEIPTLAPEIAEFLQAGEPPIVFTLGSAAVYSPGRFYADSIAAAQKLQRRAILLIGQNPLPANLPATIAAFDYAPFSALFSRSCAIVHQGGIGTTAQGLRSGRPTLVVPYSHDQPDNADRLVRLGTSQMVFRQKYSVATATQALQKLLTNPRYAQKAQEIAPQLQSENGVQVACDEILKVFIRNRSSLGQ
jgi:rhamnosyltransferase subunit B